MRRGLRAGVRMELSDLDQTRPEGQYSDNELDAIADALLDPEKLPAVLTRFPELRDFLNRDP